MQRHRIGHRMTNETTGNIEFVIKRFFERQECQNQIRCLADFENTFLTPGPDRRADIVNSTQTALLQTTFKRDVEVRSINAHEHIRLQFAKTTGQIFADFQQAWQPFKNFHHAHYRQFFHLVPGFASFRLHQRTRDTHKTGIRMMLLQGSNQPGAKNVTGRFTGHQANCQNRLLHCFP
ncbi:hypothetical protein SRABI106_01787 [Rahnella aquatilis]|nr:hypothetical protein SRABI106_01787 [Rahnella aquatilis]